MSRALVLVGGLGLAACADGAGLEASGAGGGPGAGGAGGGGGGPSATTGVVTSVASSTAATTVSASSSSGGEGGAGGEGGGPASSSSSGVVCDFTSPNDCATAQNLGAVAGDESGGPIVLSGTTSQWFRIRFEERVSSISSVDLSYRVTLTSPPGMVYEVYTHLGPRGGQADCNASPTAGQSNGVSDVVQQCWSDQQGIGGQDDSRWLSIEVRYVSGESCGPESVWQLEILGNPRNGSC